MRPERRFGLGALALLLWSGCEAECAGEGGQCGLVLPPRPETPVVTWTDGMSAPLGSGLSFVFDEVRIAERGEGFDLDDHCRAPGECVDNGLYFLGRLGNDQIRQSLLGGETLLIAEITGLDVPIDQDDDELTISLYSAEDADSPFFPANNFQIPPGETECCEFLASPSSLDAEERPYIRIPARLVRGRLSSRTPISTALALSIGDRDPAVDGLVPLERLSLTARLSSVPATRRGSKTSILVLEDVLMGVAIPSVGLAMVDNPYCKTLNQLCPRQLADSTLLDLIINYWQPDVDLDSEPGLEQLDLGPGARLERCLNEASLEVPSPSEGDPTRCIFAAEMGDGYSIAFSGHAVEAAVLGVESGK